MYYRRCGNCGAYLDPGEPCDCLRGTKKETAPLARDRPLGKTITTILYQQTAKMSRERKEPFRC